MSPDLGSLPCNGTSGVCLDLVVTLTLPEAATIPLAAMTSALALYQGLNLPLPFRPATESIPLVIYGGSSAVGAFAIKLARASNIHPIITVAGRASEFTTGLIDESKGDVVIDYRDGNEATVNKIKEALKGVKLFHAFDGISENDSILNISQVIEADGVITTVLPTPEISNGRVERIVVDAAYKAKTPFAQKDVKDHQPGHREFASAFFPLFGLGLAHGWFSGHPYKVVQGGLGGLEQALRDLKANKASAFKYVLRIGETQGI